MWGALLNALREIFFIITWRNSNYVISMLNDIQHIF
jgi:hypothetical protein